MSAFFKAKKLWEDGQLVGESQDVFTFPTERITNSTPREAWISQQGCGGCNTQGLYQLSLVEPTDPATSTTALKGVLIEFDGKMVVLDADLQDVMDAMNAAAGTTPTVAGKYNGDFPWERADIDQAATYQITRTDAGTEYARQQAVFAYLNQFVEGTFTTVSRDDNAGTTVYQFKAYQDPRPQGTDTITSETVRTFTSNQPAALATGEQYELVVIADGNDVATVTGSTLANANTAALAVAAYAALAAGGGSSTVSGGKIILATKKADHAVLTVNIIPV